MSDDFANLITQVKDANDIVDVVGAYVALSPAGQTFKGLCPFHDDRRPSFDVDPRRQRFRCWSCGKFGDVISFIQEQDRVSFLEALELLARRAGISLKNNQKFSQEPGRALMLEVVRWAEQQFHQCLLESPLAETARTYLGERRLTGDTIRRFALGFAPLDGDWLTLKAKQDGISLEQLEQVGLVLARKEGKGYFDAFRDRVMFPIRDAQGRPLGFGGRILPSSPFSERGPKYKNTRETPLFNKSWLLYGLDQAKQAAAKIGFLAVVEGYTDVLMAHQMDVAHVVATMGTALNDKHVKQLGRHVGKIILVFDADAGGTTGVDRALEVFVQQEIALQVAALPLGMDPCDLFLDGGPDAFAEVLATAQDVLDFKLHQVCDAYENEGVEGQRRAVDEVLRIIAKGPGLLRQAEQLKRELMMTKIAQKFGIKEETLWARLQEMRGEQQSKTKWIDQATDENEKPRTAIAKAHERELLEILLAEPSCVAEVMPLVALEHMEHPGLRQLLEALYRLDTEGVEPSLDHVRSRVDNKALTDYAFQMQDRGLANPDRASWLQEILAVFRTIQDKPAKQDLQQKLLATTDPVVAAEILKQLQNRTTGS